MVQQPFTLFALIATAGNRCFTVDAQRHDTASLRELSPKTRFQGSTAQLLGDVATVCVVPITSAFLGQVTSESPSSFAIAKDVLLGIALALLVGKLLKGAVPKLKQVDLAEGQPTEGACFAEHSPKKGLNTSLWNLCMAPLKFGRRCMQRRRLYVHKALLRLERIVPDLCGSSSSDRRRFSAPGSHGMHDWHEALPHLFLMPVEVVECQAPPELRERLKRLLSDRWEELELGQPILEEVPEDETMFFMDEPSEGFADDN